MTNGFGEELARLDAVTDPAERAIGYGKLLDRMPTIASQLRERRRAAVNELRDQGLTHAEIGELLGLHPARAAQIAGGRTAAPARPSFREWLKPRAGENTAIGDLARDVLADDSWPRGTGSLDRYVRHLEGMGAAPAAVDSLGRAWRQYELNTRRPKPVKP